ncbi:response regulator [Sphingomonas sp. PB2P12]|uniref:response regulator transcription factor n=1 Tax=Sphingomonas sandaracina TaxID=3096157 RepID=UPI002FC89BB3
MTAKKGPNQDPPIVYILDDDSSVRAALEDLLASVGLTARAFGSTRAFLDADRPNVPSCLILDVRMPGQSGMEFHGQMVGRGIRIPVIFITGHGDIAMSVRAMKAGAIEFLSKPFANQDLLDAIHRGIELDRNRLSDERHVQDVQRRYSQLNDGEQAVMALVVQGSLNKQIAGELGVSEITIKVRRRQAMLKMGATSLPELVRMSDMVDAASRGGV